MINKTLNDIQIKKIEKSALEICCYLEVARAFIKKNYNNSAMPYLWMIMDRIDEQTEIFKDIFETVRNYKI